MVRIEMQAIRFSVRSLLLFTFVVCLALATTLSWPAVVAGPMMGIMIAAMPAVLAVAASFGQGYTRSFGIGALFPTTALLFAFSVIVAISVIDEPDGVEELAEIAAQFRLWCLATWIAAIVSGSLASLTFWAIRPEKHQGA